MLFNSFFFLLIFLPLSLLGWFGLNKLQLPRVAKVFLILMSFWFYGTFDTRFIPVLLTSVFVNYAFSMLSDHIARNALRRLLVSAGMEKKREEAAGRYREDRRSFDENVADMSNDSATDDPAMDDLTAEDPAMDDLAGDDPQERGHEHALDRQHQKIMASAARRQRVLMFFGVLFNLAFLAVFKYGDSILDALAERMQLVTLSGLQGEGGGQLADSLGMALPVGISFYTFSQIAFVVDRCRGDIGHDSFLNYCLSVVFFPKVAEGPITRYQEIGPQFHDPDRKFFRPDNFTRGLCLFIFGLAKKVLIADNLAPAADFGFANTYYLDTVTVIVTLMAYMFQLYFDFSGYMDMAMGIGWMFNIELPLNFDSPFKAVSFSQFWQRWHMTLTRFFTRYVYIPLGGSRHGQLRTVLNIMIVFILSAFWHGTGWNFLYWGVLSGAMVVLCNFLYRDSAARVKRPAGIAALRIVTAVQFAFTLIFFRTGTIDEAVAMIRRFFYPTWPGFLYREAGQLEIPELYVAQKAISLYAPDWLNYFYLEEVLILLAVCIILVNGRRSAVEIAEGMADAATNMAMDGPAMSEGTTPMRKRTAVGLGILLAWCMLSLSGVTTYLYFQF